MNCRWVSLVSGTIKILGIYFSYDKKLAQKENFTKTVTSCKRILGKWKQRWLAVLGRIQVFKVLIASKPVYTAIMKTVSQEFSEALASLQKDFIWGGRRPKIKHATLIADYKDGGLKDVDIDSKFESLKFMWIQKLKDDSNHHPWKVLAQKILEKCDSAHVFHSNLKLPNSTAKVVRDLPSFYRELILLWEKISGFNKLNNSGILCQYLWNNLYITSSRNETLFCQNLIRKNIRFVIDLIDVNGRLKSWDEISKDFNIGPIEFLEWYGLIQSIPSIWKASILGNPINQEVYNSVSRNGETIIINNVIMEIGTIKTRHIYEQLIGRKVKEPSSKLYFNRKFDLEEDFPWDKVYTLPYNTTVESKTRVFQYKILNNILYLNKRLYRMELAESPLCGLCKLHFETVSHLFFECKVSSQLWKEIQGEFYPYLILPNLDIKLILFGILHDQDQQKVKNHIILSFKKFLYENRLCPDKINVHAFKSHLTRIIQIEYFIAKKNSTLEKHFKKWERLIKDN